MLRRRRAVADPPLTFGDVVIDRVRRRVTLRGDDVELSAREFDILCLLAASPDRPHTRVEILDRVWGWDFDGSPRTVDNFILALRRKLEVEPSRPRLLRTVRGVGYTWHE
jgi:DNA-binding response OmpR family regulator